MRSKSERSNEILAETTSTLRATVEGRDVVTEDDDWHRLMVEVVALDECDVPIKSAIVSSCYFFMEDENFLKCKKDQIFLFLSSLLSSRLCKKYVKNTVTCCNLFPS